MINLNYFYYLKILRLQFLQDNIKEYLNKIILIIIKLTFKN